MVRRDLKMPIGKACSQAGHAYLMSFLAADAERQRRYHSDGLGTKICLEARSLDELLRAEAWAKSAGLPCSLITDTGNNTTFGGVATISALGIGPLSEAEARPLRRLQLLP